MKKKISLLLALVLTLSFSLCANAEDDIKIIYNGERLQFDQPPIIVDGRTLVPMRAIFEAIGAEVTWDEYSNSVTSVKNNIESGGDIPNKTIRGINLTLTVKVGDSKIYVNGRFYGQMDVCPQITSTGRVLVPLRIVSEIYGCTVSWNSDSRTITIQYDDSVEKEWLNCAEGSFSRPVLPIETTEPVYWDEEKDYVVYKYERNQETEEAINEYKQNLIRLGFSSVKMSEQGSVAFFGEGIDEIIINFDLDPQKIIIYQRGAMG